MPLGDILGSSSHSFRLRNWTWFFACHLISHINLFLLLNWARALFAFLRVLGIEITILATGSKKHFVFLRFLCGSLLLFFQFRLLVSEAVLEGVWVLVLVFGRNHCLLGRSRIVLLALTFGGEYPSLWTQTCIFVCLPIKRLQTNFQIQLLILNLIYQIESVVWIIQLFAQADNWTLESATLRELFAVIFTIAKIRVSHPLYRSNIFSILYISK